MTTSEDAIKFVKANRKLIIDKFCRVEDFPSSTNPFTMFMAGCPGVGKTEFSKSIIPELQSRDPECKIVRIDADEIRSIIPQFTGSNSKDVQTAAIIGVEKVFDYVQDHRQNCIMDGTFAHYEVAHRDIVRSINKGRKVGIFYIYLDPEIAWDFTKKREALEGRNIPKDAFISAFFKSKDNVIKIKEEFGSSIEMNIIIKNSLNKVKDTFLNAPMVDKNLGLGYTMGSLAKLLVN